MSDYPHIETLKRMYPQLQVKIMPQPEGSGMVHAREIINGRLFNIEFKAETEELVIEQVYRLWHWENTGKTLVQPIQYVRLPPEVQTFKSESAPVVGRPKTVLPAEDDQENAAASGRGAGLIGTKWIKELSTGAKSRLPADEAMKLVYQGTHVLSGPRAK